MCLSRYEVFSRFEGELRCWCKNKLGNVAPGTVVMARSSGSADDYATVQSKQHRDHWTIGDVAEVVCRRCGAHWQFWKEAA